MNAQQHSLQSATKLIQDNPAIFNKFYDKELRLNIIASALLQFSIDMDKSYIEDRDNREEEETDNGLHPIFNEIINSHFKY